MYFHQHWMPLKAAQIHQYFGLAMLASGVVYVTSAILSGEFGKLLFGAKDPAGIVPMTALLSAAA